MTKYSCAFANDKHLLGFATCSTSRRETVINLGTVGSRITTLWEGKAFAGEATRKWGSN